MKDTLTAEQHAEEEDGHILRFKSREWCDVEFFLSKNDGELNIEIKEFNTTWMTVAEAKTLRDWLNKWVP